MGRHPRPFGTPENEQPTGPAAGGDRSRTGRALAGGSGFYARTLRTPPPGRRNAGPSRNRRGAAECRIPAVARAEAPREWASIANASVEIIGRDQTTDPEVLEALRGAKGEAIRRSAGESEGIRCGAAQLRAPSPCAYCGCPRLSARRTELSTRCASRSWPSHSCRPRSRSPSPIRSPGASRAASAASRRLRKPCSTVPSRTRGSWMPTTRSARSSAR